ncbi:hypothetical protein EGW08_022305 [Elysia chlorotica]|uniref:Lebercilin domain-containing protein n=1 Tax=Elysia chlorotica TaxID=188477 RepID=A0A433SLD1_ELYCH|nr:hypothetical protein EGW08_022305 [Elysia chlorotica]
MSMYSGGSRDSPARYSDDFVSDDDRRTESTPQQNRLRGGRGRGRGQLQGRRRGGLRGRGNSRNSEPADMRRRGLDNVTTRVMSASRNKINELRNKVEEMKLKMREMEQENKLFKKLQYRQEKAIRGFENKENDLPNIIDKHNNEVRSLKEQNRRLREKHDKTDRYLRDAEDELERVKRKMVKYKKMCEDKELPERDELAKKLSKAELDMEERDVKIKELQRHVESLKKNHRHELGIEAARQRELKKQLEEATEKTTTLENVVKEKDKALDYNNIYSNPNRNRSTTRDSSPMGSPGRSRAHVKSKASSLTDLTPRDKAKFYAEKKRAELLKQKEIKAEQEKKKRQKWEDEEREREAREKEEREAREERERKEREEREREEAAARVNTPPQFNFRSIDLEERDRDEQERRKKAEEQRIKRERETKNELERKRIDLENRRDQDNKHRKEREDRETKEREEFEKREKERKEREKREKEESERREREREEQERRARLERERLDNDPTLLEERRKKDELLRKLQAMDTLGSAGSDPLPASSGLSLPAQNSRLGGGDGFDSASKRSDPKEYSFTNPVKNLHKGVPSHDISGNPRQTQPGRKPTTVPSGSASGQDDSAGYQPSFGPPGAVRGAPKVTNTSKTLSIFDDDDDGAFKVPANSSKNVSANNSKKSSNLLENLFGPQAVSNNSSGKKVSKIEDDKTFFVTSQATPSPTFNARGKADLNNGNTTTFPWDTKTTPSTKPSNKFSFESSNKENSATLFGGGAALIDDDFSSANGKVLPRRRQQANLNTFSAKPSVIAMDNFDDDLEEVVL